MASARGAALWAVAAIGYLVLDAAAAAGYEPAYSYARNFISDLGIPGRSLIRGQLAVSSRAYLMHAAFYLQGVAFLLGALLIAGTPDSRRSRLFLGATAANALGNVVIATTHSGKVHVAGAVLAIVGGNTAILLGSSVIRSRVGQGWYSAASTVIAVLGLSCLAMLLVNSLTARTNLLPDGVWERGSVYSIVLWQLLTAACVLTSRRATRGAGRSAPRTRPGPRR